MKRISNEWITFLIISILLLLVKFPFHELWKDEWQAWLVARDQSFLQMFSFLNYEGHPSLWYLFLKPFTLFSNIIDEDILIKIAHVIPVLLSLYILIIRFTFPFLIKILSALSYFLFFEYSIVCRGYILVILLSFLCVFYIKKGRKIPLAISIFLLCQTEVYGVMITGVLLFYQYLINRNISFLKESFLSFILGSIVFIITVYPRGNEDDFSRAYNKDTFSKEVIKESFQGNLANTFGIGFINDTSSVGVTSIGLLISILFLGLTIFIFKNKRDILFTWLFGLFGFILFGIIIYTGGVRQWGMLFLLFVCLLEFHKEYFSNNIRLGIVSILFLGPLFHNLKAVQLELKMSYTNAKEAGNFIKEKIPANVPIISLQKFETANAAAYADRKFYELPSGNQFSYFKWLEKIYLPTQTELVLFSKYKGVRGIVVIAPKPVDEQRFPFLKLWQVFNKETIKNENYYFYILNLEQLGSN